LGFFNPKNKSNGTFQIVTGIKVERSHQFPYTNFTLVYRSHSQKHLVETYNSIIHNNHLFPPTLHTPHNPKTNSKTMEILEPEITNEETLIKTIDAPSPSLNTTYYPRNYFTLSFEDESSSGHLDGVPRHRPITFDGKPSKDNAVDKARSNPRRPTLLGRLGVLVNSSQTEEYRQVMFDIRNMRVLKTSHRIAIQHFSREQLLEMIEIYDLIMKNVNYLFS